MLYFYRDDTLSLKERSYDLIRKNALSEKLQEAVDSVLPIALIVSLLCFFFVQGV